MEDKEERYGDSKKMGRIIPAYILACTLFSFSILKRKFFGRRFWTMVGRVNAIHTQASSDRGRKDNLAISFLVTTEERGR